MNVLRLRSLAGSALVFQRPLGNLRFNSSWGGKEIAPEKKPLPYANLTTEEIQSPDFVPETYPEVKREYYQLRDPYGDWDDKQNRRNIGEPLHPDDDELNMWSPEYYSVVPDSTAVKWHIYHFGWFGLVSALVYVFFYPERPAVPRGYPHNGLAQALGARNEEEADLLGARIDKTAL